MSCARSPRAVRIVPRRAPAHVRDRPLLFSALREWANRMRTRFGYPVYLCGSALRDNNYAPRDWDIRVILPDGAFARRYGPVAAWRREGETGCWTDVRHRWSKECTRYSRNGARCTGLDIDFQVYPASYAREMCRALPRFRLDDRGCPAWPG